MPETAKTVEGLLAEIDRGAPGQALVPKELSLHGCVVSPDVAMAILIEDAA